MLRERLEERFGGLDRRELVGLAVLAVLIVGGVAFWYVRSLPSRIAMLPRWPIVIDRCATSTGAAVGPREITQSMKLRKWSSLA